MTNILNMLLNLSDERFDPIAKDFIRTLLEEDRTDEQMRVSLKVLLDMCVNGSLCSSFEIGVLDIVWKHYGGSV